MPPLLRGPMTSDAIRCPRDHAPATLLRESGGKYLFFIDYCEHCGGTWLDHGEFAKLVGSKEAERLLEAYASGRSRLNCPRDQAAMAVRPVGGIVIDVCPDCHGMWFDRRELDAAPKGTEEAPAGNRSPAGGPGGSWWRAGARRPVRRWAGTPSLRRRPRSRRRGPSPRGDG